MKKILLLLIVLFILVACGSNGGFKNLNKESYEKLLPIESHNISINFNPKSKLIMFNDDMVIRRSDFKNRIAVSFILNKNMVLEDIRSGNEILFVREILEYNKNIFGDRITSEQFEQARKHGRIYQIEFPPYSGEEKVNLNLKYALRVKDEMEIAKLTKDSLELLGKYYWLPETFQQKVKAEVCVKTLANIKLSLQGFEVEEEKDGFIKKTRFTVENFKEGFDIKSK